jgi:glycosyltransferase involved in cell wall biosynthesis
MPEKGLPSKPASWNLSPEEYVASLYRTLLRREPDDEGFLGHVRSLRKHGDPTKIFQNILNSEEYRFRERTGFRDSDNDDTRRVNTSFLDQNINRRVLEYSRVHFSDSDFIENLYLRSDLHKRIRRHVRKVAVYYPKMSNGGTERVTSRQILSWLSLGFEVVLLTDKEPDPENDYDYGNVKRYIIPPKMMDNEDYRPRGKALGEVLLRENVDVFVNNLWDETSTVWDVLVAKSLGIPVVVGWHNIFDTRIRSTEDLNLANVRFSGYRYADLVTSLSTVDALWFRSRGISARVVHNPPTFDKLPDTRSRLDGKTIVWVARAERHQKQLDLAIKMFPLVLDQVPDAKLLIVGGGPDLDWAKEYAAALGIQDKVEFTGYTVDVAKHLSRSDVHILTSEFEGWCLALGEAWAYGVPSVMFALPYLEYVQSNRGFFAVKQGDIATMAARVVELLQDADLRKRMGDDARAVIEEFSEINVTEEWRKIFEDIGLKDDLDLELSEFDERRGLRALTTVLGDRFLSLGQAKADAYVPVLPSQAPVRAPRSKAARKALKIGRAAGAPYRLMEQLAKKRFGPDQRLRMIDLSHVGLGDNVMIWTGLFTLLENGTDLCAPGCVLHVQPILVELASRLFSRFGLTVQGGAPKKQLSPIYTPLPPTTTREWLGAYLGSDWRINWVEALDQQKTFPRNGSDLSWRARARLNISEKLLYKRDNWAQATPSYVGYRVWLPVAAKFGVYPLIFLSQMKRSLVSMRAIVGEYIDDITPLKDRARFSHPAAFPTGKSFQTIPPKVYQQICSLVEGVDFTCYVQNDSAWIRDYEKNGVRTSSISDIRDTFRLLKYSKALLTTDSFSSHIAQILRDDFVLVLSRDMRESIVHPGAHPIVVENHPACAPCNYQERYHFDRCVAGYSHCIAFESESFVRAIADNVMAISAGDKGAK